MMGYYELVNLRFDNTYETIQGEMFYKWLLNIIRLPAQYI